RPGGRSEGQLLGASPDLGLDAETQRLDRAAAGERVIGAVQPLDDLLVGEPAVPEHRDRPAQVLHRTLGGEERGGHHHRVVGTAPEPDDLAVLQPGLADREPGAGELDDVRHREPLVLRNYSAVVYHILQSFTGNDTPSIWRSGPLSATFT